ncbi:MAG: leucine-rich repeat protein [Bacteroidaceae bacterium]|nr:leucine-rich repeat protein [Bacteroidaceae bacterium]
MKKRLLLLLCLMAMAGSAAWAEIAHGNCKRGSWVIDDDGTLFVNIDGDMADYGERKAPWYDYADKIKAIHISSDCTNIGRHAFFCLDNVESVTGGENVEACAMYSFYACGSMHNPIPLISFPKCDYVGDSSFEGVHVVNISLPLVETYKKFSIDTEEDCRMIDLGKKVKMLRAGSLLGPDYIFIQNPTPPDWERHYEEPTGFWRLWNPFDRYCYPLSYEKDSHVIVPKEYLQTYIDFYPPKHPEVKRGYMCAYFDWDPLNHERTDITHTGAWSTEPSGKLVEGEPIYDDGKFVGGWFVEDSKLYVVLSTDTMPDFGDNAPWKSVLGSVEEMHIEYVGSKDNVRFTIPNECFTHGTRASESIRGIKEIYFKNMGELVVGRGGFRFCKELQVLEYEGEDNERLSLIAGDVAFQECESLVGLSYINIKRLGTFAFYGCKKLWISNTMRLEATDIPECAFENCESLDELDLFYVKTIGPNAFKYSGLKEINIANAETVGDNAFFGSSLKKITFAGSTLHGKFGSNCFAFCNQLTDVYVNNYIFPNAVIPGNMFDGITLSDVTLHAGPVIYGGSYENHPLFGQMKASLEFDWPVGSPDRGWELISGQDKEQGVLRIYKTFDNFTSANKQPWHDYREFIRTVDIDYGITNISDYEFADLPNCISIRIPQSCKKIGSFAFSDCPQLKDIQITGVEELGSCVFMNCTGLEYISLGMGLKKAGNYIFKYCTSLKVIDNKDNTPAEVNDFTFADINSQAYHTPRPGGPRKASGSNGQSAVTLNVDDEHVTNYIVDKNWGKFHIKIADGRGTWVAAGRFGDGTWILYEDSVMLVAADKGPGKGWEESNPVKLGFGRKSDPNSIVNRTRRVEFTGNIKRLEGGFSNFPNLESVSLCPSIKTLDGSFGDCPNLRSINLENVDTIGEFTFVRTALNIIDMPNVKHIGRGAFSNCKNLLIVTLGQPCEIKSQAFFYCDKLESINLSEANLEEATNCFSSCYKLKGVKFSGRYLPKDIFSNCFDLTYVELGENLDSIDANAFRGCGKIDTIYCATPTPPALPWGKRVISGTEYPAQAFYGRTLKNIHLFVPADMAVQYRKANVWKDMTIETDTEYEDILLPTGGAVGEDGTWFIDSDGTLTLDFDGKAYSVNVDGSNMKWHDVLVSWLPFIKHVVISERVNHTPAYMVGEHNPEHSVGVKSVELGSHITSVAEGSLNYSGLQDVYCYAESCPVAYSKSFDWEAIERNNATLHVVTSPGVLARFQASKTWSKFPNIVADLESRLPAGIFHVTSVEGLEIWFRVTDEAAKTCETYVNETVGSAVERNYYTQYDKLTIPSTVQYNGSTYTVTGIGDNSFYACTNFKNFILPETLESIGVKAFASTNGMHISDFTLPASVKFIAENAFDAWIDLHRLTVLGQEPPITDANAINTYWEPGYSPHPILLVPGGTKDAWNVAPWNLWFTIIDKDNPNTLTYKVKPGAYFNDYYSNDEEYMCIQALIQVGQLTYENEVVGRVWEPYGGFWDDIYGDVYYNKAHKRLFYIDDDGNINIFDGVSPADNILYTFKQSDYDEMAYTAGENIRLFKAATIIFPESTAKTDIYFTARNEDGIDITYRVLDLQKKTCEVKADPNGDTSQAVASDVSVVKVPFIADGYVVTGIAADAFSSLSSLQSITLPMSIRTIGANAFGYCENVADVYIDCDYPPVLLDQDGFLTNENNFAFESIGVPAGTEMSGATLYVPYGCEELYDIYPWNYWFGSGIAPDPDGIGTIGHSPLTIDHAWYDLSGRKFGARPTKAGIYIRKGKKVVIK